MITVWGRRNSVNVQKVLWALEELDVPYTRENVGGSFGSNQDADYLAMNPMGLVPVIRDGDVTMFESNAIVRYLAARFRAGVLRPAEHRSLAMAEQWMEWAQVNFAPAVSTLFVNRVRSLPEHRDVAAAAAAEKKAAEVLVVADAWIARHDWFAGQDFSFGDIVMGASLWRYTGVDCIRPPMPHLMEWFEAVQQREAFRRAVMAVPRAKDLADWKRIEKETA
ncbi:MAG: glutathione S-transferase family protein [Aestuariivirga sp.]|uniref:glutathione S-transferase family protein n=1 Tax=Aestuariivirga sp. TaxID=2650926 RepID=UPI00301A67E5